MTLSVAQYIPMALWGRDHWSTLGYVESVMVECGGFECGFDARMKSNRRSFRIMNEDCPKPKRPGTNRGWGIVMKDDDSTRLNDGSIVFAHDDWACLEDMANLGLFENAEDVINPGMVIHLSDIGRTVVSALRQHKAAGGTYADFRCDLEAPAPAKDISDPDAPSNVDPISESRKRK